jgi:hypothetical protein
MTQEQIDLETTKAKEKQKRIEKSLQVFDDEFLGPANERINFLCKTASFDTGEKITDNLLLLNLELLTLMPFMAWHRSRERDIKELKKGRKIVEEQMNEIKKLFDEEKEEPSLWDKIKGMF